MSIVRKPAVAGMFYPEDKKQLENEVRLLLDLYKPEKQYDKVYGLVSPHAGYVYSGKTAAFGYNAISGKDYKTVVVISPSHREYFPGVSIYSGDAYETPLGIIEIDKELRENLIKNSKSIFAGVQGHRAEHALEVQLPFLQAVLKNFKLLPVVMGDQSRIFVDELANRLAEFTDEDTLIVASSDLSHFYPREEAEILDSRVEKRINDFDYIGLQTDLERRTCEACGGGGIVSTMKALDMKDVQHSEVIYRNDSGDITGDTSEVVGYLSAVIYN